MSIISRPARPYVVLIAAMSLDGKLAAAARSPARFGSAADRARLEQQVAAADGVLFGAGTLRAYQTTLPVRDPSLLQQRRQAGKPPQPVQIVCSRRAELDPRWRFFQQPVPRWLLTTTVGATRWSGQPEFDRVLAAPEPLDWPWVLAQWAALGLERLALLGGGELVASFLTAAVIDELYLTLCPLLLGGQHAPTLCDGDGVPAAAAGPWQLLAAVPQGDEVFLRYRRRPDPDRC